MAAGHHRRRRPRLGGRRFLLGFGVTGAGLAAIAIAVAVSVGAAGGGQACAAVRHPSAMSLAARSVPAGTVTGTATHYVLGGLPNCSYPSPPADGLFVALSPAEYASAGGCGGYLEVTGPDGSVRVEVVDQCPECATGHIDVSEPAFARLAALSAGLISVRYTYLTDPALPGPVTLEVKTGSSPYWLALLAGNTGNPLASVQVRTASGRWSGLARASYNYWITSSGAGSGPFTVRLTDTAGNRVTVDNIALSPGTVQSTGTYMYGAAGSAPAPVTAAPPAATSAGPSPAASASAASSAAPSSTATMTKASSSGKTAASASALASARRRSAAPKNPSPIPRVIDPQLAPQAPAAPSASPGC